MAGLPVDARSLLELAQGYQTAAVLITYAQLGIAEALAGGPRTTADLAAAVGADAAALERLLLAAVALGLVERRGDAWHNTALAQDVLVSESPHCIVNALAHQGAFYRRWGHLTDAIRTGRRPEETQSDERAADWARRFTLMLRDVARLQAPAVASALVPLLRGMTTRPRVIDVGGGHGEYAMELARRLPALEAVVFDLPPVIAVTEELVARAGLSSRVRCTAGDFHRDPLGSGYHLALLFGVLVSEDEPSALRLLDRIRETLVPGGWIAITAAVPRDHESTLHVALRDLHMLLSTDHGRMPSVEAIEAWLHATGYTAQRRVPVEGSSILTLLVARKPGTDT